MVIVTHCLAAVKSNFFAAKAQPLLKVGLDKYFTDRLGRCQ